MWDRSRICLCMSKTLPKNFTKLASSPTLDGIKKNICRFYCSDEAPIMTDNGTGFALSWPSGKVLSTQVVQTVRGFFFGHF